MPLRASLVAGTVTIDFGGINGKLTAVSATQPIGFELCAAGDARCRFVSATLQGDRVHLAVPHGFSPARVRYCWGDGPVCTLYDSLRLPAVPFEMALSGAPHHR